VFTENPYDRMLDEQVTTGRSHQDALEWGKNRLGPYV